MHRYNYLVPQNCYLKKVDNWRPRDILNVMKRDQEKFIVSHFIESARTIAEDKAVDGLDQWLSEAESKLINHPDVAIEFEEESFSTVDELYELLMCSAERDFVVLKYASDIFVAMRDLKADQNSKSPKQRTPPIKAIGARTLRLEHYLNAEVDRAIGTQTLEWRRAGGHARAAKIGPPTQLRNKILQELADRFWIENPGANKTECSTRVAFQFEAQMSQFESQFIDWPNYQLKPVKSETVRRFINKSD
jgi:hypothetical protein